MGGPIRLVGTWEPLPQKSGTSIHKIVQTDFG